MTGSSISNDMSVAHHGVPEQRRASERTAADQAKRRLAEVVAASERLERLVAGLDEVGMRAPSLLPGWTRGHVVTHLARNADALVNLLTWARTGVEHPLYPSRADRDADIEEGADRLAQVLREDLGAACARFAAACERLSESQWSATVTARSPIQAASIPSLRLFELFVHTVDLDVGYDFADIPAEQVTLALELAISRHLDRPDGPTLHLRVVLPDGSERTWEVAGGSGPPHEVAGPAAPVIAWLTGRGDGAGLAGDLPALPDWG